MPAARATLPHLTISVFRKAVNSAAVIDLISIAWRANCFRASGAATMRPSWRLRRSSTACGRTRRCEHRVPRTRVNFADAAFSQRRHLGRQRQPARAGGGQCNQPVGAHERHACRYRAELHLRLAGHHRGGGRAAAAVGHVDDFYARDRTEEFRREVAGRADPGKRAVELAGIELGIGDQFLDGASGHRWMDHQHMIARGENAQRGEIGDRIGTAAFAVRARPRADRSSRATVCSRRDSLLRRGRWRRCRRRPDGCRPPLGSPALRRAVRREFAPARRCRRPARTGRAAGSASMGSLGQQPVRSSMTPRAGVRPQRVAGGVALRRTAWPCLTATDSLGASRRNCSASVSWL